MDEKLRLKIMIALAGLCLFFMALWIGSCGRTGTYKKLSILEKEKRLDTEKSRDELLTIRAGLEARVRSLEQTLADEAVALDGLKKSLTQQQLVAKSLQDEMAKLNKAKQELEEQLKQAVWQGKISAPAKTKK